MKTALARTTLLSVVLLVASPARAEEQAALLHSAPSQAEANRPLRIEGTLVDGARRITGLIIRYRGPGEPYASAPMARQPGRLFRGAIPAEHLIPPGVEYYVEGTLKGGRRVPVFQSEARPARVIIQGELPLPPEASTGSPPDRGDEPEPEPGSGGEADEAMAALSAELPDDGEAPEPSAQAGARRPGEAIVPKGSTPSEPAPEAPGKGAVAQPLESKSSPLLASPSGAKAPPRSELEEDLALYSAEDTLALATRHTESVTRVPAIAASFGRDQLRALGARTVADVLDVVPGLTVSRDVQGFHRVAIRGLRNDAEVLFLLNGHRLNNFFDGRALMNLPVENLDRIEVIRGPGSALYGAGAFLGVVNLVTDRSEGVRAAVSGGGFPSQGERLPLTLDGHASAAMTSGSLRLFGDLDVWGQEGDSSAIDKDALDQDTLNQNLRAPTEPAGNTQDERLLFNLGLGMSYDFGAAGRVRSSVRFLAEERTALIGLFDSVGEDSDLSWTMVMLDVEYERTLADGLLLRVRGYGEQQDTSRLFQITPDDFRTGDAGDQLFPDGLLEQTRVTVRTAGLGVDADWVLSSANRLSMGMVAELQMLAGYEYETNYTLDNRLRPTLATPEGLVDVEQIAGGAATRRTTLGLFAQDQWTVINPLTLTFGLRVDVTELPTTDDTTGAITGTEFVPSINPRVGLVFAATEAFVLKALYGRAFRSPTLQELVEVIPDSNYNQGRFEGNPSLRPVTVDTVELGVDLIQAAGDSRVRLRGNAFYQHFHSPIIPVDTTGNITPLRNRELGVRVFGVEGEARLEASKRANAWVNASFFRAEDLELPSQSRLLTDTPQARFNAGVSMPIGDWVNFDVVVRAGAERRNNSRSVLELIRRYQIPAYSLITAQLRTEPIMEHFEAALVAHNLFDHDLRDDVPRPDRVTGLLPRDGQSVYLTVRARY
ncbi:MAG: TonB-dependent receptor [Myxococcaceae bacterium]|nr:TonB-dependent receptor [Myxococcaceae bacterium]